MVVHITVRTVVMGVRITALEGLGVHIIHPVVKVAVAITARAARAVVHTIIQEVVVVHITIRPDKAVLLIMCGRDRLISHVIHVMEPGSANLTAETVLEPEPIMDRARGAMARVSISRMINSVMHVMGLESTTARIYVKNAMAQGFIQLDHFPVISAMVAEQYQENAEGAKGLAK